MTTSRSQRIRSSTRSALLPSSSPVQQAAGNIADQQQIDRLSAAKGHHLAMKLTLQQVQLGGTGFMLPAGQQGFQPLLMLPGDLLLQTGIIGDPVFVQNRTLRQGLVGVEYMKLPLQLTRQPVSHAEQLAIQSRRFTAGMEGVQRHGDARMLAPGVLPRQQQGNLNLAQQPAILEQNQWMQ